MSAIKFIQAFAKKSLTKNQGSGIINLPGAMQSEAKAGEIVAMLQQAGIPMNQLDDFIRSEADVAKFLNIIEAASKPKVYSGQAAVDQLDKLFPKKGEVVQFPQKTSFKEQVEAMKKSGDIVDPNNLKKNDNVLKREMFQDSNLNKTDTVTDTITYIKTLEPMTAMKEANLIIGRKGKYKDLTPEQSKKILQDTEDHIFERDVVPDEFDPEYAKGGRAGFYTGGITDVEPSLDDIGHGADALNARTRLMSPGNQATTSTGLNYLLAEDNDNMRIPFAGGGDPKRRAFLKLMATLTGGAAAFKSGLLSLGEGGTKKAVTETVKQAAGSGGKVPPYFLKLVEKIQKLGDDVTPSYAVKDRQKVTKYKDYELTEDVTTGEQTIQRMKIDDDFKYDASEHYGKPVGEEVYMSYKPGKGQVDETMKGKTPPDEYIEDTSLIRTDKPAKGGIEETFDGVPDDILEEVGEIIVKKADGGRIGFSAGGGKFLLSKLGINSTSRRFLEKVFGKEKFNTMIQNDPRMHRGMLEVVEMFRSKDKDGLKMYLQKFMPNMDDTEIEKFIVGDSGTEGIEGQLIRLGSGREYENLIKMSKEADQIRKLDDFDIEDVSKNAEGGRIGFSGGGIFRAIIAKSAAKKGLSVTDFIKATNYKGLPPEVRMYISADEFAKLKSGQQDLYENFIDMAKTRKSFQENVEAGKKGPASPLFENLEKTMDEQSFVPKTVTSNDIAQMELMVKNRFNKGRKDNAQGGLQTMLGE
jgi:hypothetical protein